MGNFYTYIQDGLDEIDETEKGYTEYRDSDGNHLEIDCGFDELSLDPKSKEIVNFLDDQGYNGPNDWKKA